MAAYSLFVILGVLWDLVWTGCRKALGWPTHAQPVPVKPPRWRDGGPGAYLGDRCELRAGEMTHHWRHLREGEVCVCGQAICRESSPGVFGHTPAAFRRWCDPCNDWVVCEDDARTACHRFACGHHVPFGSFQLEGM